MVGDTKRFAIYTLNTYAVRLDGYTESCESLWSEIDQLNPTLAIYRSAHIFLAGLLRKLAQGVVRFLVKNMVRAMAHQTSNSQKSANNII